MSRPFRLRRLLALGIAGAGLLSLFVGAARSVAPAARSLDAAGLFLRASTAERLLNSPVLRFDPGLGRALLAADRRLPRSTDLALSHPLSLPDAAAEERYRAAAYVLSPRRVVRTRHPDEAPFRLLPLAPPSTGAAPGDRR